MLRCHKNLTIEFLIKFLSKTRAGGRGQRLIGVFSEILPYLGAKVSLKEEADGNPLLYGEVEKWGQK